MANTKRVDYYIRKINDAVEQLKSRHQKYFNTDLLIAYRGEPQNYNKTKLMPSLFRETDYIGKEAYLFELFCDYNIVANNASNVEKAIEAQHYASISRMLDISFNVLVALYFACAAHDDNDGYIYAFAFPEHYSPHSKYVEDFYTNVLAGDYKAYSRNFKVFSHSYSNDRIKAQKGGFIFFPGNEFIPINQCYFIPVTICKDDKKQLLEDLSVLFQINEATIFPEKDKIASVVKQKFQKNAYSQRCVSVEDEIETYFNRINYELKLSNSDNDILRKKYFLRLLRKEEFDVINYIRSNAPKDSVAEIVAKAAENFRILRIRFKEAQNGD